jgi:ABC-2 type transport system ATP-binding protein
VTVNDILVGKEQDFAPDTGIIIETPGFISYESGYKNLKNLSLIRKRIDDTQIRNCMLRVGLNPDDKKRTGKYSLGMRQRLAIAQAIMENPSLLILDEPMNGLDKEGVNDIRKLLLELKAEGRTILIASHITEDINVLCDTVIEMDRGHMHKIK